MLDRKKAFVYAYFVAGVAAFLVTTFTVGRADHVVDRLFTGISYGSDLLSSDNDADADLDAFNGL